jgi:inosine-uridine nucleoside N-ribohydrolase
MTSKNKIPTFEISPAGNLTRRDFLASSSALVASAALGTSSSISRAPQNLASADAASQKSSASKPLRVIIDSDPGVDDAVGILLALRSPELQVEAITAVAGNVPLELTLPNALRLVEIAGRTNIPIAGGASHPLTRRLVTARYAHGNNGLAGVDFPAPTIKPSHESANETLRRIIRANPGEITIAAIGPLTNIAILLRSDPEIAPLIRGIAIMGGSLSGGNITPSAEFNFYADPEAARVVFDANLPLTMVGLDVTRKVLLTEDHVKLLEASRDAAGQAAGKIMRATIERVRKGSGSPTVAMHDPLTIAWLIDPGILTLRDHYVEIETSGEWTAGESVGFTHSPMRRSAPLETSEPDAAAEPGQTFKANAKVAVEVDPERFFKLLPRLTGTA